MSEANDPVAQKELACPFCGETEFDHVGLRHHLMRDWCPGYTRAASPSRWAEWVAMSPTDRLAA